MSSYGGYLVSPNLATILFLAKAVSSIQKHFFLRSVYRLPSIFCQHFTGPYTRKEGVYCMFRRGILLLRSKYGATLRQSANLRLFNVSETGGDSHLVVPLTAKKKKQIVAFGPECWDVDEQERERTVYNFDVFLRRDPSGLAMGKYAKSFPFWHFLLSSSIVCHCCLAKQIIESRALSFIM